MRGQIASRCAIALVRRTTADSPRFREGCWTQGRSGSVVHVDAPFVAGTLVVASDAAAGVREIDPRLGIAPASVVLDESVCIVIQSDAIVGDVLGAVVVADSPRGVVTESDAVVLAVQVFPRATPTESAQKPMPFEPLPEHSLSSSVTCAFSSRSTPLRSFWVKTQSCTVASWRTGLA